ncbi:MAG: ATP-binding protein [Sedimentibacter sp.]
MKLKNKITMSICIIVFISLAIMCTSIYTKSASILNAESTKLTEIQILRAQEKIDLMVKKIQVETMALSRDEHVYRFFNGTESVNETNKYLTQTMKNMDLNDKYYKDLFIVDLDGVIVASTMPNAMYVDLSSRDYIQDGFNFERTATSDILLALSDRTNIVNTVHPIFNPDGKVLGLFGIAIRAENFVYFVNDYEIGESGYFIIIDSNGYILSHKDPDMIQKLAIRALPGFRNLDFPSDKVYTTINDGYINSYKKMDSNNWILATIMPESELAAKSMSLLEYVIIYGVIISALAIFISIYMSNKISSPIIHINNYINSAKNSNDILENAIDNTIVNVKSSTNIDEYADYNNYNKVDSFIAAVTKKIDKDMNFFDKDAESLIKQSEFFKSSLEMKTYLTSKFLSTLSHDIRTSLTLIKGYAQGLMSGIIEDEDTKKRFINEIYNSAQILEKISYDVLDSTYEAQTIKKLKREEVDADEFCKYLFSSAKDYIENSDRIFDGEYSCDNCILSIDKVKIIRVWQNIINNAIKDSDKFTTINVTIKRESNRLLFQIKDNGIGIEENDKKYIFEMFYKSDLSAKNSYGLGLYVSKLILESHNSELQFESALNKGSTFWFYLVASDK